MRRRQFHRHRKVRSHFPMKRDRLTTNKRPRIRNPPHEEQYFHDMLYHPSPAMKRLEKMIEEDHYNPSRRNQRTSKEILDDGDFDNENDT